MPQLIWVSDAAGRLTYWNRPAAAYFAMPIERILGDGWPAILHPDDMQLTLNRWNRSLRDESIYEAGRSGRVEVWRGGLG